MEVRENQTDEINLIELLRILLGNWILLVLSGVTAAVFVYGFLTFFYEKEYSSSAQIYMLIDEQNNDLNYSSQVSVGQSLASDCVMFAESSAVLEQVRRNLKLDYSYKTLAKMVSADASTDTHIVTITVVSSDPYEAMTITNEVQKVTMETVYTNMKGKVSVYNEASLATQSNEQSLLKMLLCGFVVGVFVAMLVLTGLYLLNDKIYMDADVENCLRLSVLGTIPLYHTNIYMTEEEMKKKYSNMIKAESRQSSKHQSIDMEKIKIVVNQTTTGRKV